MALPIRGMHPEWERLILYRRPVRVYPNGTMKKSSIRVGFQVLTRSRFETNPNGTFCERLSSDMGVMEE